MNVRPEVIKLLEHMRVSKLLLGYDFLDLTPNSKAIKVKISKRDNIKLKSTTKKKKERKKGQPAEWEKMFSYHIPDDGLMSKIHKELI